MELLISDPLLPVFELNPPNQLYKPCIISMYNPCLMVNSPCCHYLMYAPPMFNTNKTLQTWLSIGLVHSWGPYAVLFNIMGDGIVPSFDSLSGNLT